MQIKIGNQPYDVVDTKEKVTIADSFVVRQNKIGSGNGEAKLYIGNNNKELRDFFGPTGFRLKCFLLKKDLIAYLEETKIEYSKPEQPYIYKEKMPDFWIERMEKIKQFPDVIWFEVSEQTQIAGERVYVKSLDNAYSLIRELSLPNITYITIVKLRGITGEIVYYFKLFADYFGDVVHPYLKREEEKEASFLEQSAQMSLYAKARIGQGKYREALLHQCPYCPITMVSDERILIASHIKPWSKSDEKEKIDPYNGFMFTPTFDYLFDRGYLSFSDEKRTMLSPFLSKMTYSKLGISDNKLITHLPIDKREKYLEYHRKEIFQGIG